MNPYPWQQQRTHAVELRTATAASKITFPLAILGAILSPPTAAALGVYCIGGYLRYNDNWWRRTTIAWGVAAVTAAAWYAGFLRTLTTWMGAPGNLLEGWAQVWVWSIPITAATTAAYCTAWCRGTEYGAQRYLLGPRRPTRTQRRRAAETRYEVEHGASTGTTTPIGYICDDKLPWRKDRYGAPASIDFGNLTHGMVVGSNGSGKSQTGLALCDAAATQGLAVIFADFKSDLDNRDYLAALAAAMGVPFRWFTLTGEGHYYDPLGWEGSSSEKRSLIMESLEFSDEVYYRGATENWLLAQFDALTALTATGNAPDMPTFAWLHATSNPAGLRAAIAPLATAHPAAYAALMARIAGEDPKRLQGWADNSAKLAQTTVSPKLRFTGNPANDINLADLMDEGGIVYYGLASQSDPVLARTVGSLLLRDMTRITATRTKGSRKVLFMADEFSLMGDRITVALEFLRTARAANIYLWVLMQTFAALPDEFVSELFGNALWRIIFRIGDEESQELVANSTGKGPMVTQNRAVTRRAKYGREMVEQSGMGRDDMTHEYRFTAAEVGAIPNRMALVWYAVTGTAGQGGNDNARQQALVQGRTRRITARDDWPYDIPYVHMLRNEARHAEVVPVVVEGAVAAVRTAATEYAVPPAPTPAEAAGAGGAVDYTQTPDTTVGGTAPEPATPATPVLPPPGTPGGAPMPPGHGNTFG